MAKERKASVIYEGNASQLVYAFPFDYLRKKFVKVEDIYTNITELIIGVDYTVEDKQVRLVKGIPVGHFVKIYRKTTTDPLVEWQDASVLRSDDLSLQEVQLLHLAEEALDIAQDKGLTTDDNDGVWDARYNKIKNLLEPTEAGDAVNLGYITKNQDSLLNKLNSTGATQNKSIVATGDAQNARLIATGEAQNTRLTVTGTYQNKLVTDTGKSYVSTMTILKDTVVNKANEVNSSADLAKKWAVSDTSPDGNEDSKSAKTWAASAKTSETHAYTSEKNAEMYADRANTYLKQATNRADFAETKATAAENSATAAAKSAEAAAKSEANLGTHEANAAASAAAAAQSAENAKLWDPTNYPTKDQALLATADAFSIDDKDYTDMNDVRLLTHSTVICLYNRTSDKLANMPEENYKPAFLLFNLRNIKSKDTIASSWFACIQFLLYTGTPRLFYRHVNQYPPATTPTFTKWKQMVDVDMLPTKLSQLTNDANYATTTDVATAIEKSATTIKAQIPKATSQLTNDSGYATTESVDNKIGAIWDEPLDWDTIESTAIMDGTAIIYDNSNIPARFKLQLLYDIFKRDTDTQLDNYVLKTDYSQEAQKWKDAYNNLRKRSTPTAFDDDELTALMNTPIGGETIILSQPYTDFDGLLIDFSNDDGTLLNSKYISTAELNRRIARAKDIGISSIFLLSEYHYWTIWITERSGFSTTTFPNRGENCQIKCIYGVKLKEIT